MPRPEYDGLAIRVLSNRFQTAKEQQCNGGDVTGRTFDDYYTRWATLVGAFGKQRLVEDLADDDFKMLGKELGEQSVDFDHSLL